MAESEEGDDPVEHGVVPLLYVSRRVSAAFHGCVDLSLRAGTRFVRHRRRRYPTLFPSKHAGLSTSNLSGSRSG